MSPLEIGLILLAGFAAGGINAIVGSGTLITFPALVTFGVPPVVATMSNAVGLIPGNIASSFGYREELKGQGKRILQLLPASLLGALTGAWLLLHLPENAFESIVPVLLIVALIMVVSQPLLNRILKERSVAQSHEAGDGGASGDAAADGAAKDGATPQNAQARAGKGRAAQGGQISRGRFVAVFMAVFATAIYGGYFAAAQGIILVGLLGMLLPEALQRLNGLKNVLVLVVNTVAAAAYILVGWDRINWLAVILIALGSLVGGYVGARVGRRFNPTVLRAVIVVLGLVALWRILTL